MGSLDYHYLFLLTHLATSVASKRDLEQVKDDCCALSCSKGAKVVIFDPTGQVNRLSRRGYTLQIEASVAGFTGRVFGFYAHGLSSEIKDWWGVIAPAWEREARSSFPTVLLTYWERLLSRFIRVWRSKPKKKWIRLNLRCQEKWGRYVAEWRPGLQESGLQLGQGAGRQEFLGNQERKRSQ